MPGLCQGYARQGLVPGLCQAACPSELRRESILRGARKLKAHHLHIHGGHSSSMEAEVTPEGSTEIELRQLAQWTPDTFLSLQMSLELGVGVQVCDFGTKQPPQCKAVSKGRARDGIRSKS